MQQTIVITGGAGFVGVNFTRYAQKKGYRVIIVDTSDRLHRLQSIGILADPHLIFVPLNLAAEQIHLREHVDALFHLAALPQVDYSLFYPERVVTNNIVALLKSLEFVRERKIPILFVSSVEVYGGNEEGLLHEIDPSHPLSPYAASKVSGEAILQSYIASLAVTGSIARLTNLYGPWQAPDRVIPRLITQILSGYYCEVDGGRLRDFMYVEDAVAALLSIMEQSLWGEIFNISSEQGYDNYDLISFLQEISGKTINVSHTDVKRKDGRGKSLLSSSQKLQKASGWQPAITLSQGIKLTYEWYASHQHWWEQFDVNIRSDRTGTQFLTDCTYDL